MHAGRLLGNQSEPLTAHHLFVNGVVEPRHDIENFLALLRQNSQALDHLRQAVEKGFGGMRQAARDPDFKGIAGEPAFRAFSETP